MEMGNPGIDSSNAILPTPMRGTGTGILGTSPPKDSPSMFSPGMLGQSFTIKGGTKFSNLRDLLKQNRIWAKTMKDKDPLYFDRLRSQQNPQLLWIGCADSR